MNLTHFHPKRIENLKKSNILVNIRFVAKTSDIRNFSQNIRSDVETSVATLLWRKAPEFTLKKKPENNKQPQTYKMFKKVKTKLELYASDTCT